MAPPVPNNPRLLRRPPAEPLDVAFAAEERAGLKLAFRLRLTALALIAVLLALVNPWPGAAYTDALLLGFIATGVLSLLRAGSDRPGPPEWVRWVVPAADLALVTFAVVYPNPFDAADARGLPLPLLLRSDGLLYPIILIALSTLTLSPRQVLWSGVAAAGAWTVASFWVAGLPEFGWSTMGNDPRHVMAHSLVGQIILLLIISGLLAGAVNRSRSLVLRQVKAERERSQLGRYFSANLVDRLADADRPVGEIRSQTVAILFADIVGFTSLGETLSPVDLIGLLRDFHQRMQAAVFANEGTLDKYLGDGLMASFGTPDTGPRDAANGLRAARQMAESLATWNAERAARDEPVIRMGVGLHWGPVVLGDIGGGHRLEFATIGDTVNIASRLEHMTRDLNADIVASVDLVEAVRASLGEKETTALLDGFVMAEAQSVRGRSTPLGVFARLRAS